MTKPHPKIRVLAENLLAFESGGKTTGASDANAIFHVCEKLRPQLANLTGNVGFRALLSRALALAGAESAGLRLLHVKSNGSLEGLEELREKVAAKEFLEGEKILLSHLLGLLVAFIGENLTMQILCEVWPQLYRNDRSVGNGGKNEKAE